jgi:hypothetical protein
MVSTQGRKFPRREVKDGFETKGKENRDSRNRRV